MMRLAHLSDLHGTPVRVRGLGVLPNKRMLGWLSWRLRRHKVHRPEVLAALVEDAKTGTADQVVVTGDLTNVSSPHEFPEARRWLERLGAPERVTIVPGNHDAYVALRRTPGWELWREWLASDAGHPAGFPTLRVRGPLALVGVCSAHPTPPLLASGSVGDAQLAKLEALLADLAGRGLCRVVLIHHPVTPGSVSRRRALTDAEALRGVLARRGAELVLHGHRHRSVFGEVAGPTAPIPVVGAPSASDVHRAGYHLYEIEPGDEGRFRIAVRIRRYDPAGRSFSTEAPRPLS
jgi:3',5'-cyclic AMP phosphodiesterase CpdA